MPLGRHLRIDKMALPCQEMIDEIQARCGRAETVDNLIDDTWVTRRINEAQKIIVEMVPLIPSMTFKNTSSLDTTGTMRYAISDITVGDSSTLNRACHIADVWYLDGNESKKLTFRPVDVFDAEHPDPTHSNENFEKPVYWTKRDNIYIETYPYCASAYWDKNMRFDGDFYAADFTTDSTELSDISGADEGIILYGLWKAWAAIGMSNPSVAAEIVNAKKAWSNPEPLPGETVGWLESFRETHEQMIQWEPNFYYD